MPKLRYLKIRFDKRLRSRELPFFRAAVIEATQRQSTLFHNHKSNGGVSYRYPMIQYKCTDEKATIICLGEGADDIHFLLSNPSLDLRIGGRQLTFLIEDIGLHYHSLTTGEAWYNYTLQNWQALNQDNFRKYESLESEIERLQFLEKMLLGNLLAIAKTFGVDRSTNRIEVKILRQKGQRWLSFKGKKVLTFDLEFKTNLSLPEYIGLGKGVSVGFGNVKSLKSTRSKAGNRQSDLKSHSAY
jgi:hypothetical protein